MSHHPLTRRSRAILVGIGLAYLLLAVPTVFPFGSYWDEQVDLEIASSYFDGVDGWVTGSRKDPTQTRLPMLVCAPLQLMGALTLTGSRLLSVAVGLLALWGVFRFCRRERSVAAGLVACAFLATCPYYLSNARIGMTEGDIYAACAVIWSLDAASQAVRRRTVGATARLGVFVGLSISCKAVAAVPLLVMAGVAAWMTRGEARRPLPGAVDGAILAAPAVAAGGWLLGFYHYPLHPHWRALLYGAALVAGMGVAWILARHRRWPCGGLSVLTVTASLALVTFLLVPPVHLTNPEIIDSIWVKFFNRVPQEEGTTVLTNGAMHLSLVFFRPGVVVGAGLLIALAAALARPRKTPGRSLAVALFVSYFLVLAKIPAAQAFYMTALFPVLAVFLAEGVTALWARANRTGRRVLIALAFLAVVNLGVDFSLTYPALHLNGYQWLGTRYWLGRSSIGPRNIVLVPEDGVQQAMKWLSRKAGPEDVIVTTISKHNPVLRAHAPKALRRRITPVHRAGLLSADWVILSLSGEVDFKGRLSGSRASPVVYPYDRDYLLQAFEKVFAVRRPFGIEPVTIWRRKPTPPG